MKHILLPMVALLLFISCTKDNSSSDSNTNGIQNNLQFTKIGSFSGAPFFGIEGSEAANALFFAHSSNDNSPCSPNIHLMPEFMEKFDLSTNTMSKYTHCIENKWKSKAMTIIGDKLFCLGSHYVCEYSFDVSQVPTEKNILVETISNPQPNSYANWTRHAVTALNNDIYIFGGHETDFGVPDIHSRKVFKYNTLSKSIQTITTLPSDKYNADGEIINNKLYVFGGTEKFSPDPSNLPQDHIYIYDLASDSWETKQLPKKVFNTFTDTYSSMIIIGAGKTPSWNTNLDSLGDNFLGVFNPSNNTTTEINCTFSPVLSEKSHYVSLTIVGNKIYLVTCKNDGINHIYAANLN